MPDRIVTDLPLATLWDEEGRDTPSRREHAVGPLEIRELLRREEGLNFVVANVGEPLRRIGGQSLFEVWKKELAPRVVDPARDEIYLDVFPGEMAYAAYLWRERGHPVVVLEAHH